MKNLPRTAILVLLCLVPHVEAYHLSSFSDPAPGETIDIRNRLLATNTANLDNAAAGELMNYTFPWDPEFSYQDRSHTIRLKMSYTAAWASNSNGAWNVTVAKELTGNLTNCTIRVETIDPVGISLDAFLVYATWNIDCVFTRSTNVHYHYHTIFVNRTVQSGSPATISAESISVRLEAEDVVVIDLPSSFETLVGVTGIEFFVLLAVVATAIIIWSRSQDFLVQFGMGVLCQIPTIVWLMLAGSGGSPANVTFKVALAVVSASIGAYLMIRTSIEGMRANKEGSL